VKPHPAHHHCPKCRAIAPATVQRRAAGGVSVRCGACAFEYPVLHVDIAEALALLASVVAHQRAQRDGGT